MWLLETSVRQTMQAALKSGFVPSAEQQAKFEARLESLEGSEAGSSILTVAGDTAEVAIKGVLTNSPDFLAVLFGGGNTTYSDIISAIALAEQDSNVKDVTFNIDSPGGQVDGLFSVVSAIRDIKKPTKASISNLAASAAFVIASQADEVIASNISNRIGNIGIVASLSIDENEVTITNTESPKKRPDVTTKAGIAAVREELDALHNIAVDVIAEGRNTSADKVNAKFGQGATLLAGEALKRGMIDGIAKTSFGTTTTTVNNVNKKEKTSMDTKELNAQHPDVYAEVLELGAAGERDRVTAHLKMGEASGDMKTACLAIAEGSGMTATLQATYLASGMNRTDLSNSVDDDAAAAAATAKAKKDGAGTLTSDVVALVESKLGLGV